MLRPWLLVVRAVELEAVRVVVLVVVRLVALRSWLLIQID